MNPSAGNDDNDNFSGAQNPLGNYPQNAFGGGSRFNMDAQKGKPGLKAQTDAKLEAKKRASMAMENILSQGTTIDKGA